MPLAVALKVWLAPVATLFETGCVVIAGLVPATGAALTVRLAELEVTEPAGLVTRTR